MLSKPNLQQLQKLFTEVVILKKKTFDQISKLIIGHVRLPKLEYYKDSSTVLSILFIDYVHFKIS